MLGGSPSTESMAAEIALLRKENEKLKRELASARGQALPVAVPTPNRRRSTRLGKRTGAEPTQKPPGITDLPVEVILMIAKELKSKNDLLRLAKCCKFLFGVAYPECLATLDVPEISGINRLRSLAHLDRKHLRNVKRLDFTTFWSRENMERMLLAKCTNLASLIIQIDSKMIFDDLLTALGRVCLTLRYLCVDIRDHALVPVDAFEVSLPALQNVRFEGAASGQWMNAIARGAPALERAVCRVIAAHGMPGGKARWSVPSLDPRFVAKIGFWEVSRWSEVEKLFRHFSSFSPDMIYEDYEPGRRAPSLEVYKKIVNLKTLRSLEMHQIPTSFLLEGVPSATEELGFYDLNLSGLSEGQLQRAVENCRRANTEPALMSDLPNSDWGAQMNDETFLRWCREHDFWMKQGGIWYGVSNWEDEEYMLTRRAALEGNADGGEGEGDGEGGDEGEDAEEL